jgi:predicted methyltransferase
MRTTFLTAGTALIAALAAAGLCEARGIATPAYVTAAVSDTARPEADTKRDADRHPALTLAYAGVKPGDQVAELAPGGGYFTRLLSAVVGPKGKVYAVGSPKKPDAAKDAPEPSAAVQKIAADPHYGNVVVSTMSIKEVTLPEAVDLAWTSQNYHDLHNIPNADVVNFDKAVFSALKPGGVFIVLDHVAAAGSGFRDTSTLHRIDPEAVKKEVESAGFKFEGASEVLHNPADDHTLKVFDPAIRGKTDQFILKFRKPR